MKNLLLRILSIIQGLFLKLYFSKVQNRGFLFHTRFNGFKKLYSSIDIGNHAHLNNVLFDVGSDVEITIGEYSRLNNVHFHCYGNKMRVKIGSLCQLKDVTIWGEDVDGSLVLGNGTYIGGAHLAVTGNNKSISIGANCMLSDGITIRTGDSHAIIDMENGAKINDEKNVIIGSHVWLTQNVTVLKGTNIGENSIVGTGSIVSGHFGDNLLIGGNPAKVLKSGVTWSADRFVR